MTTMISEMDKQTQETKAVKTFRFKFSDTMIDEITRFSRIHKYDDKQTFKEAWNDWKETNHSLIQQELTYLQELGFDGDIEDKIYKSIRYYYCKKSNTTNEPKKRRKYISIERNLLTLMDRHILMMLENNETQIIKPAVSFSQFVVDNHDVENERIRLQQQQGLDKEEIELKLKKTYKNRYFILSRKE